MAQILKQIETAVEKKSLLKHPFYQMWNNGTLPKQALVEYAKQYYHFTEHFPRFVARVYSNCTDVETRKIMIHNLIEEELGDFNKIEPHAEQWLAFAESVGVPREDAINAKMLPDTEKLLATFEQMTSSDFTQGVACLLAYETQVSEIAKTKREGLKNWFGITDPRGLQFFDTHEAADIEHSQVWKDILAKQETLGADERVLKSLCESLDAQWAFLDGIMEHEGLCMTCQ